MKQLLVVFLSICAQGFFSQQDSSLFKRVPVDTSKLKLNMDAVYNRPFLTAGKIPIAIGGYVEANSNYLVTDGVSEGLSFHIPRMTLFVSSSIKQRIKFLSELELEDGGKEISLEFASMDISLHPLLNIRGGIIMNPIGGFNQNHDGPKWEFISRPLSATTIIPSTFSNVGFGLYGKYGHRQFVWAYECYVSNGFDDKIISNTHNRTWLAASKQNPNRFEESFNGIPLVTVKTAIRHRKVGEIGCSWMGGVYNQFIKEGFKIDQKRRVDLIALDFNSMLPFTKTQFIGEWVWAFIDVPNTYTQQFGKKQAGGFLDFVQPVLRKNVLGWQNSTLNVVMRLEYVDYNIATFRETKANIYDHLFCLVPGISFRPSPQTVIRFNYRYQWQRDILGNPASQTSTIQFGFSSYF